MKKLYRSRTDKRIAGVFGGIAEVYDLDPTLLRLAAIFVGAATAVLPIIIAYLIAWIVIPKGPLAVPSPPGSVP